VLVIGGGIVGAGIARDAAMRGLNVKLVEQHDFASGTSSKTSRLLHGGLRYLAQGNIKLVHEASREKVILKKIAPHLSTALPFVFPTRKKGTWKKWKLSIGVKIYDWLCYGKNFGPSQSLSTKEITELVTGLNSDALTGGVRYYDGFTCDSRLVIDTLRSASRHGAEIRNYCRFVKAKRENKIWNCTLTTKNSGNETIQSKFIVNASGPWCNNFKRSSITVRPSKGAHLIIHKNKLSLNNAVVMPEGKRILFAIPWGERVILGTTDTYYDGPLNTIKCDEEDKGYILNVVNKNFPNADISKKDILSTYAGLRPLVYDGSKGPSDISRKHEIKLSEEGWLDVAGGKLTTYRLIAEETVDKIYQQQNQLSPPCHTANEPLLTKEEQKKNTSHVIPPTLSKEVVFHYCANEWARHLNDVMIRRSGWKHYVDDSKATALQVLEWMSGYFSWDKDTQVKELERYYSS